MHRGVLPLRGGTFCLAARGLSPGGLIDTHAKVPPLSGGLAMVSTEVALRAALLPSWKTSMDERAHVLGTFEAIPATSYWLMSTLHRCNLCGISSNGVQA